VCYVKNKKGDLMKNIRKRKNLKSEEWWASLILLLTLIAVFMQFQESKNVVKPVTETYEILSAKSIYGQMTNGQYVSIGIAGSYSSETDPIKGYEIEILDSESGSLKTILLKEEDILKFISEDDYKYVIEKTQTFNERGAFVRENIEKQTLYLPKSVLIENSLTDIKP